MIVDAHVVGMMIAGSVAMGAGVTKTWNWLNSRNGGDLEKKFVSIPLYESQHADLLDRVKTMDGKLDNMQSTLIQILSKGG